MAVEREKLQVIPQGLVHVTFPGLGTAALMDVSLTEAVTTRDALEARPSSAPLEAGQRQWFFHAFNKRQLIFFIGRWSPGPGPGGRYLVEQRLRVRRSTAAVAALKVGAVIQEYEKGVGELRAGMSEEEAKAIWGTPQSVIQLGPVGSFDYLYPSRCVRFLDWKIAHIWPRANCVP